MIRWIEEDSAAHASRVALSPTPAIFSAAFHAVAEKTVWRIALSYAKRKALTLASGE